MDAGSVIGAAAIGFAGGMSGGLLGVGGGVMFVPALVLVLGLSQLDGESTSLLAIVPVAILGAWRQRSYGNLRFREGFLIGALSFPGVLLGTALANTVSERVLELSFAALQLFFAVTLARKAFSRDRV